METFPLVKLRIFRCKEIMFSTLDEYEKSNFSIKAFCPGK
jgi:hypothetical protein